MGFPDEGVCPYFEDSPSDNGGVSLLSREVFFETRKRPVVSKKRPLQNEEDVPLFLVLLFQLTWHCLATPRLYTPSYANDSVYAPLHSERGRG